MIGQEHKGQELTIGFSTIKVTNELDKKHFK